MTRKIFKKKLEELNLSQKDFAEVVGYSYQTIKQWKDGSIPQWVPMVLDYLKMIKHNTVLAQKYNFC